MTWLDDEDAGDPFAEQLLAYDGRLAASEIIETPSANDLAPEVHRELEPALECLRLLKELRVERSGGATVTMAEGETASVDAALIPGAIRFPAKFGRFALRRELGRGGFGIVFLAWDPSLKREVAVKLPRPDCLMTPPLKRRFLQEGHAAAGLEHPNIVTVYEAGEIGGVCYIVAAYCPGPTLAEWLKQQTAPVPFNTAAHMLAALADGIDHAHRRGILHRDLKPSNILLSRSSTDFTDFTDLTTTHPSISESVKSAKSVNLSLPRITDFGLAKLADGSGDQTRSGAILGTPLYMAPEQVEGKTAAMGPATDVYALGVILYELLTGRRPFARASEMETLRLISTMEPERPRRLRPQVPRDLETICLKCLEKEPRRRFASAADLAADLRRFLKGEPTVSRPAGMAERLVKWARRRPAVAALVGVSLAAVVAFLAAGAWHLVQLKGKNVALQIALEDADNQRESARLASYGAHVRLASEFLQNGQGGLMADVLNRLRPAGDEKDVREFSWSYLWRLARNEQALRGHCGAVHALTFSKDGTLLASGSDVDDMTVHLWDTATGRLQRVFRGLERRTTTVALSPDSRWLAAGDYNYTHTGPMRVSLWDVQSGALIAKIDDRGGLCGDLSFSPDSRSLLIPRRPRGDGLSCVLLWNHVTGEKRYLGERSHTAMAATFAPDGKLLAVAHGSDEHRLALQLLDLETGEAKARFDGASRGIMHLNFAPDGQTLVSTSSHDTLRLWDVLTRRERVHFSATDEEVWRADFSEDGKILATVTSPAKKRKPSLLKIRDPITGKALSEFPSAGYEMWSLAVAPDGQTVALGGNDKIVHLRRIVPQAPVVKLPGHLFQAWAVAFAPDSRTVASAGGDGIIRLSDPATAKQRTMFLGHVGLASCLAYHPEGHLLASGGYDKSVKIWESPGGKLVTTINGHAKAIRSIAFAHDGKTLASGSRDKTIKLWNPATGELLATLEGHTSDVRGLAFSPDGRWLLSAGDDRLICLWDAATLSKVTEWTEPGAVQTVAFGPDGKSFASAGRDGSVKLWDLATKESRAVLGEHSAAVASIAFSPDGKTLASGSADKTVRLWHVPTGQELICFKNQPHEVNSVSFSKDGKNLASAYEDGSIRLWASESRK